MHYLTAEVEFAINVHCLGFDLLGSMIFGFNAYERAVLFDLMMILGLCLEWSVWFIVCLAIYSDILVSLKFCSMC